MGRKGLKSILQFDCLTAILLKKDGYQPILKRV